MHTTVMPKPMANPINMLRTEHIAHTHAIGTADSVLLVRPVVRCGSLIVSVLVAVASTVLFSPRLLLHSLLQSKDAEAPAGELEDGEIAPQRGRRLAPPRPPQLAARCRGD